MFKVQGVGLKVRKFNHGFYLLEGRFAIHYENGHHKRKFCLYYVCPRDITSLQRESCGHKCLWRKCPCVVLQGVGQLCF